MIVAVFLIALGYAIYADRIGDQERCEAELRTEFTRHSAEPSRADYRAACRPERRRLPLNGGRAFDVQFASCPT